MFQPSPRAKARVDTICGDSRILIVDEFYMFPFDVREYALRRQYDMQSDNTRRLPGGFYPGILSTLPTHAPQVLAILRHVAALVETAFAFRPSLSAMMTDFAMITFRPEALVPAQRHPHADVNNPFLGLLYLTPGLESGTSFYRNRETGMYAARSPEQQASNVAFSSDPRNSRREDGYIRESNRYWEKIYSVPGVFNRFVFYEGQVFHSPDVYVPKQSGAPSHRLTQRFLVFDKPVEQHQQGVNLLPE